MRDGTYCSGDINPESGTIDRPILDGAASVYGFSATLTSKLCGNLLAVYNSLNDIQVRSGEGGGRLFVLILILTFRVDDV